MPEREVQTPIVPDKFSCLRQSSRARLRQINAAFGIVSAVDTKDASSRRYKRAGAAAAISLFLILLSAACSKEADIGQGHEREIPTATLMSEILQPEVLKIAPTAAKRQEALPASSTSGLEVPEGTRVIWSSCASDGTCYPFNFYWPPTNETVMLSGEPQLKVQHEFCHAHQHWSINGGEPLEHSDYDLESWYVTSEGQSFSTAVAGLSWPWSHSLQSGLEDFAWTCAYWYLDPSFLKEVSPERYEWAAENLE